MKNITFIALLFSFVIFIQPSEAAEGGLTIKWEKNMLYKFSPTMQLIIWLLVDFLR